MADIVDSYSETNQDVDSILRDHHPSDVDYTSATGQSFTCTNSKKIVEAKFYLKKVLSPTGFAHAVLYAHSGTYGTNSLPTGSALATSDDFDVSTLTTSYQLITFIFTGIQQYIMQGSPYYCIAYENPAENGATIDASNYILIGIDESSPVHSGNLFRHRNGVWDSPEGYDVCFYVYGDEALVNPLISKPFISPDMIRKAKIR